MGMKKFMLPGMEEMVKRCVGVILALYESLYAFAIVSDLDSASENASLV